MQNFFARMEPWAHNDGALHLYVLPSEEERERLGAAQSLLADVAGLPPMPHAYLHLTLQKLAHFDDELPQAQLSRLGAAIEEALQDVGAFELELGAPTVADTAITCNAAHSPAWDALVDAVRAGTVAALGPEPALPAAPHGPHVTLSYATAPVANETVAARLEGASPIGTVHVTAVHLVSVTVRPELGIFDFTHLANWDLAPATP